MPTTILEEDVQILGPERELRTVPEELFFQDKANGIIRPNTIPLPDGVPYWNCARFMGEDVHVAKADGVFYMLADTTIFDFALFRFVSDNENDSTLRIAFQQGDRIITKERSQIIMAGIDQLSALTQKYPNGVSPMSLDGGATAPAVKGEGVASNTNFRRLRSEALARGYVAGYVMANAPSLSMHLTSKAGENGTTINNIVAKESKPTRCLAVMLALPANCVMSKGSLATPSDIIANAVDYGTTPREEMVYQDFPEAAAISYIDALGGRLPEYAPFVSDAKEQWSAEEIISGAPSVSYVYVKPVANTSKKATSKERFRFHLKTTSERRCLYTEKNHVCLRALEHVSTEVHSAEDVYRLNEIAFGSWSTRFTRKDQVKVLKKAMDSCPTQIWATKYTINGETKEGIGSCFFMEGSKTVAANGETVSLRPLTYIPWNLTAKSLKPTVPPQVKRIVKRTFEPATATTKERYVTSPVLYKDRPNDPLFRGYANFVDFIEGRFITRDKLLSLGERTSKAKVRTFELTPDQRNAMDYFIRSESVAAQIQAVCNASADRAVLNEG